MAQALGSTPRFRLRLLGYDRREVSAALTATQHELERAVARRDELISSTANVQRIGAEVAEMLRSLADRAVEVEVEASAKAEALLDDARGDAAAIRADAAAVLAAAHVEAEQIREASRVRQAAVGRRRESAITALQVAMHHIRQLTGTIEEIDLEVPLDDAERSVVSVDAPQDDQPETVVLLPWSATSASSASSATESAPPEATAPDPIDPVLARITSWASNSS